jgi:hypothetical protein
VTCVYAHRGMWLVARCCCCLPLKAVSYPVSASAPAACTDLMSEPGVRTRLHSPGSFRARGNDLDAGAERDPILDLPRVHRAVVALGQICKITAMLTAA